MIHDIKGENWQLTAGFRSTFSHCLLFNPADPKSARYNPLLEVRKREWEVRDVLNIADILVDPEGALEPLGEDQPCASRRGHSTCPLCGEREDPGPVASFLSDPSRSIERTLRVMMSTNHMGTIAEPKFHPVIASMARELLNKSENERSGLLSTAMSFLGLYRDPVIALPVIENCGLDSDHLKLIQPHFVIPAKAGIPLRHICDSQELGPGLRRGDGIR